MMVDILIFVIKCVGVSAVLWLIYLIMFHKKASYISQRIFLTLTPVVALIAATLSLEVIAVEKSSFTQSAELIISTIEGEFGMADKENELILTSQSSAAATDGVSIATVILLIYLVVAAALITKYIVGYLKIKSIEKLATKAVVRGYCVYKSGLIATPFSYLKAIYISREMDSEKLSAVLKHEMAHVNNRHYIDKLTVDFLSIIFWFNPFVWRVAKQLTVVHEFEADREALSSIKNKQEYKRYIFDEIVSTTPAIANGFNSSLIKTRLIEMGRNAKPRMRMVRKLVAIPAVMGVLILTSFTYSKPEQVASIIDNASNTLTSSIENIDTPKPELPKDIVKKAEIPIDTVTQTSYKVDEVVVKSTTTPTSTKKDITIKVTETKSDKPKYFDLSVEPTETKKPVEAKKPVQQQLAWYLNPKYTILNEEQFEILDITIPRKGAYVVRHSDYTQVDIIIPMFHREQWTMIPSELYLVDAKSGDKYMLHQSVTGVPLDKTIIFKNCENSTVRLSFIFPPLKSGVKKVDIVGQYNKDVPRPSQTINPLNYNNISVLNSEEKLPYYKEIVGEVIYMK